MNAHAATYPIIHASTLTLVMQVTCNVCKWRVRRTEPSHVLSLNVVPGNTTAALNHEFGLDECLDDYKCDGCGQRGCTSKVSRHT